MSTRHCVCWRTNSGQWRRLMPWHESGTTHRTNYLFWLIVNEPNRYDTQCLKQQPKREKEALWVNWRDSYQTEDLAGSVVGNGDCPEEGTFEGILVHTLANPHSWLQRCHAEKTILQILMFSAHFRQARFNNTPIRNRRNITLEFSFLPKPATQLNRTEQHLLLIH